MSAGIEDKVYERCEALMKQLISEENDINKKIYADEYSSGLSILSSCILECIDNDVMYFNEDTAKGILYCLTAQFASIKTFDEVNYDSISQEIVGVFNIGKNG